MVTKLQHVGEDFLEAHISCRQTSTLALPFPRKTAGTYIEKLFKGKLEARLVICGSFGLHMHDSLLEDLLVPNIGLDQSSEARNNGIGLLVELEEQTQRHTWVNSACTGFSGHCQIYKFKFVSAVRLCLSLCFSRSHMCSSWQQDADVGVCRCKLPSDSLAGSKHR